MNSAAQGTVNALCSTDAGWCEAAATEFMRQTGIKVLQAHKGTGEFGFDRWRFDKYPVKSAAPCEGTSYEIGGIALVKGARNKSSSRASEVDSVWVSPTAQP